MLHDLLVAKLEENGLDKPAIKLVNDKLRCRKQREKIVSSCSDWANFTRDILQRSILGPLLFNIFINDFSLFIEKSDICKFADDSILFSCGDIFSVILKSLEHDMKILLRWFKFTYTECGRVLIYDSSEIPKVEILPYNRAN